MNTDTILHDLPEELEGEFENIAEQHRMAAHHFKQAARHHMAAADANESGDPELTARHSFLAYRHRLAATQYAEIAALDDENPPKARSNSPTCGHLKLPQARRRGL